jgi:predicted nucleotidyltransferase component of viral defense system
MTHVLQTLLNKYTLKTADDSLVALREIIQQISLLGLWRAKFYEYGAFYGGTALRIFYGLPRYSEDLDFSLTVPNQKFSLDRFLNSIQKELQAFGFLIKIHRKEKKHPSQIESAFIKAETVKNLIYIETPVNLLTTIHPKSIIKVKIEVDIKPPPYAEYDMKTLLVPIPHHVKLFSLPDLFAGKAHALLCRQWKSRVKGRDYFDFVWFIGQQTPCHLKHLKARMVQTGHFKNGSILNKRILIQMLLDKFQKTDFNNVIHDVRPFITDPQSLNLWNKSFFNKLAEEIEVKE